MVKLISSMMKTFIVCLTVVLVTVLILWNVKDEPLTAEEQEYFVEQIEEETFALVYLLVFLDEQDPKNNRTVEAINEISLSIDEWEKELKGFVGDVQFESLRKEVVDFNRSLKHIDEIGSNSDDIYTLFEEAVELYEVVRRELN